MRIARNLKKINYIIKEIGGLKVMHKDVLVLPKLIQDSM